VKELESRSWYGNVRELRNAVEHAMIVARGGVIEPDHLPEPASAPDTLEQQSSIKDSLATLIQQWAQAKLSGDSEMEDIHEQMLQLVEPPLFQAAIDKYHGQCAAAARRLGLHRTTLRKKLDQYEISTQ
jgi:two-component system nitrogen regulation response regulator GlnG